MHVNASFKGCQFTPQKSLSQGIARHYSAGRLLQPLLAGALETRLPHRAQNPTRLDHHYETLRLGMRGLFQELGIAA